MTKDKNGHPDLLELDALRAGEAGADVERHVESCPRCRAILEDMTRQASSLREGHGTAPPPPKHLEVKILADLAGTNPPRQRHLLPAAGVAAAILILFLNFWAQLPPPEEPVTMEATGGEATPGEGKDIFAGRAGDVNGDGNIDEADVRELDRLVSSGRTDLDAWDFNGDGSTDRGDIDLLAGEITLPVPDSETEVYFGC